MVTFLPEICVLTMCNFLLSPIQTFFAMTVMEANLFLFLFKAVILSRLLILTKMLFQPENNHADTERLTFVLLYLCNLF